MDAQERPMYGPSIKQPDGAWKKTFLIAFIDDASRVITHAEFFYRDNTENMILAFRSALYKRGKPQRLYFDNGSNYSSKEILQACVRLDIHLSHAPTFLTDDAFGDLAMTCNLDIKSRITYSRQLIPLNDHDLIQFVHRELDHVGLSPNLFDEAALQLILRNVQGNLRLCRNLCHASRITACRDKQRIVTPRRVNDVLIQPHWRTHDALIKQQVQ